jgi:arylsulfatase A
LSLIKPEKLTVAEMLQGKGYQTAIFEKWLLGWNWRSKNGKPLPNLLNNHNLALEKGLIDHSCEISGGPCDHGFDRYVGDGTINQAPFAWVHNRRIVTPPTHVKPPYPGDGRGFMATDWDRREVLPTIKKEALAFISEAADTNKPFFLYLPLTAPHTPIVPAKEFQGKSKAGDYGDLVVQIDDLVGSVSSMLEAREIADNTIVIFTCDNGSHEAASTDHGHYKKGSLVTTFGHHANAPWSGRKGGILEGGHRLPFFVRWPGKIKPGTVNNNLIGLVDLMATLAALTGAEYPKQQAEDSRNLLPTLLNPNLQIRKRLVIQSAGGQYALRFSSWKYVEAKKPLLFNLNEDPRETKNVISKFPEIAAQCKTQLAAEKRKSLRPD